MVMAFVVWSIVAIMFFLIGISCLRAKEAVGFFTFCKPPKVKELTGYNRAVAMIWFVFSILLEMIGVLLLFMEQNSPSALLIVLATLFLVVGIIIAYIKVECKYKE